MQDLERLWSASLDQLKAGYSETAAHYTCLCCGKQFEKGIIYPAGGLLYEAQRFTRLHIAQEHGSVFAFLLGLDKRVTGLSDLQKNLLLLFYEGKSDTQVQREMGIGSTSTVRNHRFLLREKERQAKLFQAIMELLREAGSRVATEAAPQTKSEESPPDPVIQKHFPYWTDGPLRSLSIPQKERATVLGEIAGRFESGRRYTEADVNQLLSLIFADHVTLRRYLVDEGFLGRLPDGSQYWRTDSTERGQPRMDHRKELKRLAKEAKTDAGIYRITNTRNGKAFLETTRNLKTVNGARFQLENGSHPNKELQREWNEYGPDAFTIAVLEVLEKPDTGNFDEKDALKKLKEKWLEQLQPFGEGGYHTRKEPG